MWTQLRRDECHHGYQPLVVLFREHAHSSTPWPKFKGCVSHRGCHSMLTGNQMNHDQSVTEPPPVAACTSHSQTLRQTPHKVVASTRYIHLGLPAKEPGTNRSTFISAGLGHSGRSPSPCSGRCCTSFKAEILRPSTLVGPCSRVAVADR